MTLRLTKGADATARLALAEIVPETALIVVEPTLTGVAKPVALIVATETAEEVQVEEDVRFCVLPSE